MDASYTQILSNTYLSGTAKTNFQNSKTALDTAYTNLKNSINTAIADNVATSTEKANVDAKFVLFNTALATYQTRLEEANKAIQAAIDSKAKGYVDNIQIGGANLVPNSNSGNFSGYNGSVVNNLGKVSVAEWGATDANRVTASGGTSTLIATRSLMSPPPTEGSIYSQSCWFKNNGSNRVDISMNGGERKVALESGEAKRIIIEGYVQPTSARSVQFQVHNTSANTGNDVDFTWWRVQVEYGNKVTAWSESPAEYSK